MFDSKKDSVDKGEKGHVREPGDGYIKPGVPDLSPTAGYENTRPVQYADESDFQYQQRLTMWEKAYASAKAIEAGNPDIARREQIESQYKLDIAELDAREEAEGKFDKKKVK